MITSILWEVHLISINDSHDNKQFSRIVKFIEIVQIQPVCRILSQLILNMMELHSNEQSTVMTDMSNDKFLFTVF